MPVAYHDVYPVVSELYALDDYDLVLHIGVNELRSYFAVEASSARLAEAGYGYHNIPDTNNQYFSLEEQQAAWPDVPNHLTTDLDLTRIVDLWKQKTSGPAFNVSLTDLPPTKRTTGPLPVEVRIADDFALEEAARTGDDVRWSDNVGFYLCGFMYYCGLAERYLASASRDLTFLHIPWLRGDENIAVGVEVTTALIESLVESFRERER